MSGKLLFVEFFVATRDIIMLLFNIFLLIARPFLNLLLYILTNFTTYLNFFVSFVINSIIYIITLFKDFIHVLTIYLEFIPKIIKNIMNAINYILDLRNYIFGFVMSFLGWFFNFAENGNEDEFF